MQHSSNRSPGFAVIDLETTGFVADEERIVEVAVVILDADGNEEGSFCTLIDPGCDPGPTQIHGISAEMLVGAPSFAEVHPYLADLLSGRVVVGHNVARFDLPFLVAECRRLGGDALVPDLLPPVLPVEVSEFEIAGAVPASSAELIEGSLLVDALTSAENRPTGRSDERVGPGVLDTLRVAQDHLGLRGKAKLIDCCDRYGLTWDEHHHALGDARVTAALLGAMRDELGDEVLGIHDRLQAATEVAWPGAAHTPLMPQVLDRSLSG